MHAPPVALFAFNRPELTRRTFEAIRRAAPPQLFLICDGPRADCADDVELCRAVRSILEHVDWKCDVHRFYSTANLGFSASIELGLDRVFTHVTEAVILEDDCVADPSFFRYCTDLLDEHRAEPSVCYIGGFALDTPSELFNGASYAFSGLAACWGWATWSDRWEAHRRRFPRDWSSNSDGAIQFGADAVSVADASDISGLSGGLRWFLADLAQAAATSGIAWDALWAVSVAAVGGCAITPSVNMIENIGFGPGAANNTAPKVLPASGAIRYPLVQPPQREISVSISRELEFDVLWFPVGRISRSVRRLIPVGQFRTSVLRVLTSAAVIKFRSIFWRLRASLMTGARLQFARCTEHA